MKTKLELYEDVYERDISGLEKFMVKNFKNKKIVIVTYNPKNGVPSVDVGCSSNALQNSNFDADCIPDIIYCFEQRGYHICINDKTAFEQPSLQNGFSSLPPKNIIIEYEVSW